MTSLAAEAGVRDEVGPGQNVMVILDKSGDTKHVWDRNNPDDVTTMRTLFDEQIAGGMQAFSVTRKGDRGAQIREFDPDSEKIIFSKPLVGG